MTERHLNRTERRALTAQHRALPEQSESVTLRSRNRHHPLAPSFQGMWVLASFDPNGQERDLNSFRHLIKEVNVMQGMELFPQMGICSLPGIVAVLRLKGDSNGLVTWLRMRQSITRFYQALHIGPRTFSVTNSNVIEPADMLQLYVERFLFRRLFGLSPSVSVSHWTDGLYERFNGKCSQSNGGAHKMVVTHDSFASNLSNRLRRVTHFRPCLEAKLCLYNEILHRASIRGLLKRFSHARQRERHSEDLLDRRAPQLPGEGL